MTEEKESPPVSMIEEWRRRVEAEQKRHFAIVESTDYKMQLTRLEQMTSDFLNTLVLCWFATTRAGDWVTKSLFMRSIDDLNQSAILIRTAVREGARNSARREQRYMIELAIKALFTDQQMPTSPLEHRLEFFKRKIDPSSISEVKQLRFEILEGANAESARQKLLAAYSRACAYVHPSVQQIEERLKLAKKGVYQGFETAEELGQSNDEVFETLSLIIVVLFEAIGEAFAGDIFETGGLSSRDGWIFHGHPFVAALDEHFDYKSERQEQLQMIQARRAERLAECDAAEWPDLKPR